MFGLDGGLSWVMLPMGGSTDNLDEIIGRCRVYRQHLKTDNVEGHWLYDEGAFCLCMFTLTLGRSVRNHLSILQKSYYFYYSWVAYSYQSPSRFYMLKLDVQHSDVSPIRAI